MGTKTKTDDAQEGPLEAVRRYILRREEEIEPDPKDLDGLDRDSRAYQLARREGMFAALHDLDHLLLAVQDLVRAGLWSEQPLPALTDEQLATMRLLNPDQAWFWTRDWYDGEREIDERLARGEHGTIYMSDEEFLAALDRHGAADANA